MPAVRNKDVEKEKVLQLKGKEAEERILKYMKEANRPYGAADVSANIKGVVSKPATQKILALLAERGLITQKTYGKTSYYVANQSDCDELSSEQFDALEGQIKALEEEVKDLTAKQKQLNSELKEVRSTPKDAELDASNLKMESQIEGLEKALEPLRAGAVPISEAEVLKLEQDWMKWKIEWVSRKKVFKAAWGTATESLDSNEGIELADQLGQSRMLPSPSWPDMLYQVLSKIVPSTLS
ncbi:hypothetical protein FRB96_003521 [Tulasnella sp. 330]|nr:hypothetical protein FRB96_003521 [Tulasnella sp. 330]KAG8885525.1 hypothetical protein FRB97_000850 [Tulasnella sp. 331]